MEQADPLLGRVLGAFRVEKRLGAGGIGAVYAAAHTRTGKRYAVKVLLPEMAMKEGAIERFRREAQALAALGHAGIVQIHDFDVADDGTQFLAMDLLEGEDLATRIERGGPVPLADALRIADELGSALAAAHAVGIIHRDLKPANVFLATRPGAPERATILDFGLAKNVAAEERVALTKTGAGLGTPLYMSPEQARGDHVDLRTDVYALGCIVFEMLAGTPPFHAATLTAVIAKILSDPPPSVAARAQQPIPPGVDAALRAALAKDAAARPQSAAELVAMLHDGAGMRPPSGDRASLVRTAMAEAVAQTPSPTTPDARSGSPILATVPSLGPPAQTPMPLLATRESHSDAVSARASTDAPRRSRVLVAGLGLVATLALVGGSVWVGSAMHGATDVGSGSVTVTATRTYGAPSVAPMQVVTPTPVGVGPEAPEQLAPPPPLPVQPSAPTAVERPHVARGAHATPIQRIATATERQVAAERAIVAAAPPAAPVPGVDPAASAALAAQIERGRAAQRAAADRATHTADVYEHALPFFTALRAGIARIEARQRPAFCDDGTRARLDAMARGEGEDPDGVLSNRADAVRGAVTRACDGFDKWETPSDDARDAVRRLLRDLDNSDRMLTDVEADRQGADVARDVRAALADARQVVEHADPSGRRYPCDQPPFARLRSLQHAGNGWAGTAAGNVARSEENLCRALGVQRDQLHTDAQVLGNVLDATESGLRQNIRSQRDIATQMRAAGGATP